MKMFTHTIIFLITSWIVGSGAALVAFEGDDAAVLEAFAAHVVSLESASDDAKTEVQTIVKEYGVDGANDAITESLMVLFPKYASAIETSDGDDIDTTLMALEPFANSDDKFLVSDAAFYLARALMNHEKYESAFPLLEKVHGELSDFNVHVGRARFYTGVAQAGLLNYSEAIQTLTDFLQFYPDAPERLRVAAWRQVQQLQAIKNGEMADVYQRMDFSRRKLSLIEPGEDTQEQQQEIVNMLAKLIKAQEKKEASNSNSKNQKNTKQQQEQQQQQANKQQQKSQSQNQKGGSSNNPNGKVVKKTYDNGPASPWSRLRDRSRDPANAAIKDKFPSRYRDLAERYFEAANGNSSPGRTSNPGNSSK